MTENRHKRQTVSLEGVDSGDAPAIVSRDCDYGGHKQLRIRFGHVPIRDLLDIEFRPMLRQNAAIAHVLGLACTKASGVGVSVPTDLEGGVPLGKPADAKAEHLIVGFAHRALPLEAPSARAWPCAGFVVLHSTNGASVLGRPWVGERRRPPCPSPSVMASQARAGGYNASTRGVSWSSTMKEPSFSSLRSSHLARLRYVKCSVRVSLTSGQSTFSTVW